MDIDQIRTKLTDREVGTIGKHKFFSVCIPLVPTDEGLSVLMEVRASELKTQPGDICFPGGNMEYLRQKLIFSDSLILYTVFPDIRYIPLWQLCPEEFLTEPE